MSYKLRSYQQKVIDKMVWSRGLPGNDLLSLCMGSGKSVIIAELAKVLDEKVLVLVPSRELLLQNLEKLEAVAGDISVFSASVNRKEVGNVTLGTIQSVYKNPHLFGDFDVVILDEADGFPVNKEGMYSELFKGMRVKKVYGLTGSPYRLDSFYQRPGGWSGYTGSFRDKIGLETVTCLKMINRMSKKGKPPFWTRLLAVVNTHQLQEAGYLSKLTYKDISVVEHENLRLNKSRSDFDLDAFDREFNDYTKYANVINNLQHNRILVFCSSIKQAEALQTVIYDSVVVTSQTSTKDRKKAIQDFRDGKVKVLLGVMIFVVGFDVPELDCIVSLRPTRSLRIWSQLLGRGARIAPNKKTCTVYDMVGNIKSMGTLESIKIEKTNGQWDVVTNTYPKGMHGKELYSFKIKPKRRTDE